MIKKKKATLNLKNKDDKCFQYAVNSEEIKWNPERVSNIKKFINRYKWKGINYPSKKKKMIGKRLRKVILQLALKFCILKKKKYAQLKFQK